ncbi:hypothetical protein [Corynebacterium aurimucosum]|uniref:hypothetical protein n=1 Tax=Corynebacterium aurimucosum TaxID=169292 RepID=UPI0001BCDDE9|nr:hypothetical protein [Corynebacterium aurimucosum]QQU92527.1 hypothetical protein I6I67_09845 [Corynebacterium aurimucosum]
MDILSDCLSWWTADRVGVLINALLALIAAISLWIARRSLKLNRQININANRPMMMAEILPPDYAEETLRFMVSNRGKSVAKDVRVKFRPVLPTVDPEKLFDTARGHRRSAVQRVNTVFAERVFSTWVPGYQVDVAYWIQPKGKLIENQEMVDSAEGVPAVQFVVLEYKDELGNQYSEEYELNAHGALCLDFRTETSTINNEFDFKKQLSKDLQANAHMLGRISRKL